MTFFLQFSLKFFLKSSIKFCRLFFTPLISVFAFTLIFSGCRIFEIFLHRGHLLSEPVTVFNNLIYLFFLDFLFFILYNGIYILFHLIAEHYSLDSSYKKRKWLFCAFNTPLLVLFVVDMQTVAVSGKLLDLSVMSAFKPEILFNIHILVVDYWHIILPFVLGFFAILFWFPLKFHANATRPLTTNKYQWLAVFYLTCLLLYGDFVLLSHQTNMINKSLYQGTMYNGMYFRGFIAFKVNQDKIFFFKESLQSALHSQKHPDFKKRKTNKMNVIVILVESFNLDYLAKKLMPFTARLSEEGLLLKNHISPVRSSEYSTMSLINGIGNNVDWIRESSPFKVFQHAGYETFFFFGDKESTFFFDEHLEQLKTDHYITAEDYLKATHRRQDLGRWGDIYEKPFMRFAAQKLSSARSPFLAIYLTNEPHYPFDCPGLKTPASKQETLLHCIVYVDQAMEMFFKQMQAHPQFNNTLFVITGDHPNPYDLKRTLLHIRKHNVPLIFWSPNAKIRQELKKHQSEQISAHVDILPSVLDFLGLPLKERFLFVNNFLFRPEAKRKLVYFFRQSEIWFLLKEGRLLEYNVLKNKSYLWRVGNSWTGAPPSSALPGRQPSLVSKSNSQHIKPLQVPVEIPLNNDLLRKKYEKLLKAYIQYYYHGL